MSFVNNSVVKVTCASLSEWINLHNVAFEQARTFKKNKQRKEIKSNHVKCKLLYKDGAGQGSSS